MSSLVFAALLAAAAFWLRFNLAAAGSLEMFLVVIVALRWGFLQATIASFAAVLSLNLLFTAPIFRLTVADPKNLISLVTFEATALLVSRLSSEVQLHADKVEVERKRNSKLYELSRAILLIDVRQSVISQVADLIRELIGVDVVEIWSIYEHDEERDSPSRPVAKGSAFEAYLSGMDFENPVARLTQRSLRSGTTTIGGLVLRGWNSDPLLADAVASLVAIALERARSIAMENRAEAERDVEQLRTAVLDGLAHSYKTPLTAIQTASSGLLAIKQMTSTQTDLVKLIDEQATTMSHLTTRLLQTAALEGKQIKLRRQSVNVRDVVKKVLVEQDEATQSRIVFQPAAELAPVTVDPDLIRLALLQLIDNAAKYSTVDRAIEIAVVEDPFETVIRVSNEGTPIQYEDRFRIFQRFYRGVSSSGGPTGTGLGLSIVKKFAEAHGGRAWVDFEGGKNRFSISIPRFGGTAGV